MMHDERFLRDKLQESIMIVRQAIIDGKIRLGDLLTPAKYPKTEGPPVVPHSGEWITDPLTGDIVWHESPPKVRTCGTVQPPDSVGWTIEHPHPATQKPLEEVAKDDFPKEMK